MTLEVLVPVCLPKSTALEFDYMVLGEDLGWGGDDGTDAGSPKGDIRGGRGESCFVRRLLYTVTVLVLVKSSSASPSSLRFGSAPSV